jgi:hypothetical protein
MGKIKPSKDFSEFPPSFQDIIGREHEYRVDKKTKCVGVAIDLKWSSTTIMDIKTYE